MDARSEDAAALPRTDGKAELNLPRSRLKFALRRARLDEAERSEVIAELRGAEIARLEMLKEEVQPILAELPASTELFDFGLVPGQHPRLFIDMIAFVEMGRDRRAYCFVQDTRHGRLLLAESERIDPIVDAITNYVARRLIEREKALASDMTVEQAARAYAAQMQEKAKRIEKPPAKSQAKSHHVLGTGIALLTEFIGSAVLVALVAIGAREVWQYALTWWAGR